MQSISRVMSDIVPPQLSKMATEVRDIITTYQDAEDLITIGAYKPGQNQRVDRAVEKIGKVNQFLTQSSLDKSSMEDSWRAMASILQS
jgi:flagellum-specific ATP synthase